MDTEIQSYLDSNDPKEAIIVVKKYAEINNKTVDKNLLKEDILNYLLQYVSNYKNNNNKDYKLLSKYVDKCLRFSDTAFQNNILKNI
jgi:hypothetical protein|tara:strand:- start:1033 stop:1293 length:261 start_codon:yes stop_codon:yes gene_type:complete